MRDVAAYVTGQADATRTSNEELSALWRELHQYHQKRLWHQLTGVLLKLVKRPELQDGDQLWQLYTNVIADFEIKLNPLSLVDMCTPIVNRFEDAEDALQFLEKIGDKVKANTAAFVMTRVLVGKLQLTHFKDMTKTKAIVDEIEALLKDVEGVGRVHAHYYLLATDLYKTEGDHANYYRSALCYLGCSDDLTHLSNEEQMSHAFHLCLAALLGKGIFNFGELLAHPILNSLDGSSNEWLVHLLKAFNSGDVEKYEQLRSSWSKQPDLQANQDVLYEKVCLLALMEMTFQRAATDRQLTFNDVAKHTGLGVEKVELLVMKALSKGLVKGQIDQVGQTINLTWVQPRVLDREQLKTIMGKISGLNDAISSMENMIENNAGEILTF